MIILKSAKEIEKMRECGKVAAHAMEKVLRQFARASPQRRWIKLP